MATDRLPEQTDDRDNDIVKRLTAIMIATITILAAITAFLQTDAGGRAVQANRDAQRYAIEALGIRASGQAEVDYGWYGATYTWNALDTLALSADQAGDEAAAQRYRAVRDRMTRLSPMMAAPYFDPAVSYYPDLSAFEADTYIVQATELSELYSVSAKLNNGWNDKANTYIVHLTLLAVALALFGLSTTPEDWTRWVFIAAGGLIAIVTLGWLGITVITPIDVIPRDAVNTYARAYGLAWRGETKEAIAAYDETVAKAPNYANAYYERGNTRYNEVYEQLGTDPRAVEETLRLTAADFESARKAGRDDTGVNWNLGWSYYLLGFYEESATASRRALATDPELFPVRCNLGVTLLADGKIEEARGEYAAAYRSVTKKVVEARAINQQPPSSVWTYLESCATDVESLLQRIDDQPRNWTQAPPRDLVADTPEMRAEAERLIGEIKSTLVALEYTGQAPGERPTANVSPLEFGLKIFDDNGDFLRYDRATSFESGTKRVYALYDYQGLTDGQKEIWKIYRNGSEDPSLRVEAEWELGESGKAEKRIGYTDSVSFILSSGEYTVELYIDGYLLQRGTFTIASE